MSETNSKDVWTSRWDDRYNKEEFAYGEEANNFLKDELIKLPTGQILFPGEGKDEMQFLLLNSAGLFLLLILVQKVKIKHSNLLTKME